MTPTPGAGQQRARRRRATRAPASESRLIRVFERLAIGLASLALSVGLIALVSGFFASRDQPGVSAAGVGPGQAYADLGHGILRPGQPRPAYNSDPPTSGAHVPQPLTRDGVPLGDDQLLQALEVGDVVIFYGGSRPPAGLEQFARAAGPPFTPAVAATGDAIIVAPRPRTVGLVAAAWTHLLHVQSPSDPLLREFVDFWLGRGAPGAR